MGKVNVRWLGHAAFLITSPGGKKIYIDPWLENPLSPLKPGDARDADIVLVTHDHFDHIGNAADIVKSSPDAVLISQPETAQKLQSEMGVPAEKVIFGGFGMNTGACTAVKDIHVIMVHAFHSSATGSPCGYVLILEDGKRIYHAGDTGIFSDMKLIGELYPLDLALIPIGSCFTMDPYQASKALTLLNPRRVIPMHFKTFPILVQDAGSFKELAQKEAPGVEVIILEPGQEYSFE